MAEPTQQIIDKLSDIWDLHPVVQKEEVSTPDQTADKMTLFYDAF
jgi:hypothetical protein